MTPPSSSSRRVGVGRVVTFNSRSVGHGKDDQAFMLTAAARTQSGRRFGYPWKHDLDDLLRDFEMEMTTPVPKPAYNDSRA